MKKNISLAHSLLLLPLFAPSALLSMEKETDNKNTLAESVILVPEPKTRGLGFMRSCKDLVPLPGWTEEENLYSDLANKVFDPENSSYHRKLDTTVEIFVEKENSDKLAQTFALCRQNYPKQIKIGDSQAALAHKFLTKENKKKQTAAKSAIQKIDKQHLEELNKLILEGQDYLKGLTTKMQSIHSKHTEERSKLITNECDEIRKIKTASINLHKLNKTFQLPKEDGYCSDDEKDIKNPENIKNSYNDQNLLEKIEIAAKVTQTDEKINDLLFSLVELETKLRTIKSLEY